MQQIYLASAFKGYTRYMKYISDIAHLKETEQLIIRQRLKILEFFDRFGQEACCQAFSKSRSTIFLWKKKLKRGHGRLSALLPKSRAPKSDRAKRKVSLSIEGFILNYRTIHPGVGKETIKYALDLFCQEKKLQTISESTIGRVISDLKEHGKIPKTNKLSFYAKTNRFIARNKSRKVKLRRKGYYPKQPGDLVQVDTIEIFYLGVRRYILTAIDITSAFAFAYEYKSKTSKNAQDFLQKLISVIPFPIKRIQTDNGSEFYDHFDKYCQRQNLTHFWNYPHHPQANGCLERFNRTIQEQHVIWHLEDIPNPDIFNQDLIKYLLWYNTEKQHKRLGKIPPLRYYVDNHINSPKKSNMLWTLTAT